MLRKPLLRASLLIVLAYGGLLLVLFLRQDSLLYYPDLPGRNYVSTPAQSGLRYEEITLKASDGIRLTGWFVPAPHPRGTLLYFHGNAGNISHRLEAIRLFHDLDLSVLIIDYRGYGQSDGHPSEPGTYRDAEAAWQYLVVHRNIDADHLILFGESLGAAIAAQLATQHRPAALVLAEGFTSAPDLAADLYPLLPVRRLIRYDYATRHYLKQVQAPVLVAHSREDEIVPFRHGLNLYAAAGEPRRFLELRGKHGELFSENIEAWTQAMPTLMPH